jgi:hypothetical protein
MFQFKYPKDWIIDDNLNSIIIKKIDTNQEKVALPGDSFEDAYYKIDITYSPSEGLTTEERYLSHYGPEYKDQAKDKLIEAVIAGEKGIKYTEAGAPTSGLSTIISINHKDMIFSFSYGANAHQETHLKYISIFDQILSTFKFLD